MLQVSGREEIWSVTRRWKHEGRVTALVPTMGNLHAGHLALVAAAREAADRTITSIYVNPTQFGEGEDFSRYPRTLQEDREKLEAAGCDLLFTPDDRTMYPFPEGEAVRVAAAPDLAGVLEGAHRPGHFDGVTTVVARLFNLVSPDIAVFGEKDFQQLLVIRRMTDDLGYPIRILPVPTVREQGGLAMSSRNQYLDPVQRRAAVILNRALKETAVAWAQSAALQEAEMHGTSMLEDAGFEVDYVAIRKAADLATPAAGDTGLRVLAAVRLGQTRLIDNLIIN
jgi:pantoate--beta-alanine ligase